VPGGDDDSVGSRRDAAAELGDHARAYPAGHALGLHRKPYGWQTGLSQGPGDIHAFVAQGTRRGGSDDLDVFASQGPQVKRAEFLEPRGRQIAQMLEQVPFYLPGDRRGVEVEFRSVWSVYMPGTSLTGDRQPEDRAAAWQALPPGPRRGDRSVPVSCERRRLGGSL
jgi:hypothetical protein